MPLQLREPSRSHSVRYLQALPLQTKRQILHNTSIRSRKGKTLTAAASVLHNTPQHIASLPTRRTQVRVAKTQRWAASCAGASTNKEQTKRPQISTKVAPYERRDVVPESDVQHSLYRRLRIDRDEAVDEGRGVICRSKIGLPRVAKRPGRHAAPRRHQIDQGSSKKSRSRWRPFLRTLKPAPCPWTWNAKDRALLQGTELEAVVQLKVARLDAERRLVEEVLKERVSRRTYAHACAIVASHANPWFGRSLTPFNCTLNYSKEDHITFEEDEDLVIGRARFDTHAGELFQTYAWAHTDLIYRYGFVPESDELLPEDVVSIAINDVMAACDCGDPCGPAFIAGERVRRGALRRVG